MSLLKSVVHAVVDRSEAATPATAAWTFPLVIFAAFVIAWGAEAAQFLVSQGLALALLAWLQTLPEFAVEAVFAWKAGRDPSMTHLLVANLTGSLRLIVGLGWPMVFATAAWFSRRKDAGPLRELALDAEHALGVLALAPPIFYWVYIWFKSSLTLFDAGVLVLFYALYLVALNRIPPQEAEKIDEMDLIPRTLLRASKPVRNLGILGLFVGGGTLLYFVAEPFTQSLLALALSFGINQFFFVQWVAPFLSEFPEGLSAFNWARRVTMAPMALMNLVSSNINQWTMLAAMVSMLYCISHGSATPIFFDDHQKAEILLTIAQSALGMLLLFNMRFSWYEALGIFVLWFIQFLAPTTHVPVTALYLGWCALEVIFLVIRRKQLNALFIFPQLLKKHR